jgi:hypothetical protein
MEAYSKILTKGQLKDCQQSTLHWRYAGGQINKLQLQFLSSTFVILFGIGCGQTFFKFRYKRQCENVSCHFMETAFIVHLTKVIE